MTIAPPSWLQPLEAGIPAELRSLDQWVVWRAEWRESDQKWAKVPYNARAKSRAQTNNPGTWSSYDEAMAAYRAGDYHGVGFCFSPAGPHAGVDLDKCRNPETGEIEDWAVDFINQLGTYTEASVSGTGIHSLARARLPPGGRRKGRIEMYSEGRFFTITGHLVSAYTDVREVDIAPLHRSIFGEATKEQPRLTAPATSSVPDDEELLQIARRSRNGAKFDRLWSGDITGYPSQSEADMALCSMLAFWTQKDAARMDRMFRCSGLMREKWDRRATGGKPYGAVTIDSAIRGTTEVFESEAHPAHVYPEVNLDLILSRATTPAVPPPIDSLMHVPGLVGDMTEWIVNGSNKKQPALALAASIAAVGTLLGHKACTDSDLRSNLYVMGIAKTGRGKEWPRNAVKRLFAELGMEKCIGEGFASDAAVESAMLLHPVRLFLIDELGYFLGTLRDEMTPTHVKSIVPVFMRMYTSSDSFYKQRVYADTGRGRDEGVIDQPCLSIYGTTVPDNFYENITKAQLQNGLLSRLLVFESEEPATVPAKPSKELRAVPSALLEKCRLWADADKNGNPKATRLEKSRDVDPLIVPTEVDAAAVYEDLGNDMQRREAEAESMGRESAIYTRVQATAMKLGLIRACGIGFLDARITREDAEWSSNIVWGLTERFMHRVGDGVPENKTAAARKRVLYLINKAGGRIQRKDLMRSIKELNSRELDMIIDTLSVSQEIAVESKKGQPIFYHAVEVPEGVSDRNAETENRA